MTPRAGPGGRSRGGSYRAPGRRRGTLYRVEPPPELEPELDPEVPEVDPEVPELVPELEPALPLVSDGELGLDGALGLVVVVELPVLMLLPASAPVERGSVAPERPCGDWPLLVRPPTSLPPPLFLQAPTPTIIAAAEARAISLRVMMFLS